MEATALNVTYSTQPGPNDLPGFTLIEILLVVALLGVLFSIALPQYQRYLERGYRTEAIGMLTGAATCLERHRARTGVYDTTRCINAPENGHYRLSVEPAETTSSNIFMLTATPIEQAGNDDCGSLSLDQAGLRAISGPEHRLWGCWSGR